MSTQTSNPRAATARVIILPALVCALTVACGGGSGLSDYEGVYQVTTHTKNDTACDSAGASVTDEYSHFQLLFDEFFGQELLSFGECASADQASCQDGGLFRSYLEEDGKIVSKLGASSGGGDLECALTYFHSELTDTDSGIHIESRRYTERDSTLTEEECDPDTAIERGTAMMCEFFEIIEGTPLE